MLQPLTTAIRKSWGCFKEEGVHEAFYRSLHHFHIVSVKHSLDFFIYDIAEQVKRHTADAEQVPPGAANSLRFGEIHKNDLDQYPFAEGLQPRLWMNQQFDRGSRLFAAIHQEKVVAVHWVHQEMAELDFIKVPAIRLSESYLYQFGALTSPGFRNQSIGTRLCSVMDKLLTGEKNRYAFLAIFIDNAGAKRWAYSRGCRYWGRVTYLKSGFRSIWRTHLSHAGRIHPHVFRTSFENANTQGVF